MTFNFPPKTSPEVCVCPSDYSPESCVSIVTVWHILTWNAWDGVMYIRGRGDGSWHTLRSGCVNILICNLSHHLLSLILLLFPPSTRISSMWRYLLHRFSSGLAFCLAFQGYPPCVPSLCICLLFWITACRQHQKRQAQWRRTFQDHRLTQWVNAHTHAHTGTVPLRDLYNQIMCGIWFGYSIRNVSVCDCEIW